MCTQYGTESSIADVPSVIIVTPGKNRSNGITESNELLNQGHAENVMMKDLDRTDSEDDILGEYSESCFKINTKCMRRRTGLEKCFLASVVILLIVTLALIIALSQRTTPEVSKPCETKECVAAANNILSAMDQTANPCQDFYQYACGGWDRDTPIPPGYSMWDRFQELSYKNLYHLKDILEKPLSKYLSENSSRMKTKKFYDSCMVESQQKRTQTLRDFSSLTNNVTQSDSFNFDVVLENVHLLGSWPFFAVSVGPNEVATDKDDFNIIKIDYGDSAYPFQNLKTPSTAAPAVKPTVVLSKNDTVNATYSEATTTTKPPKVGLPPKYLSWDPNEIENKYQLETEKILKVLFNKTDQEATTITNRLLQLELSIGSARDKLQHIHNRSAAYNLVKIKDLLKICSVINWQMYFATVLSKSGVTINSDTSVVVLHEEGLSKVCTIVKNYMDSDEKKSILKYYLLVHLVRSFMPYFDANTFEEELDPAEELDLEGEHWRRCVFYTNKAFGFVTGAMYVNETAKGNSVKQIQQLVKDVKTAFKEYLLKKIWLDKSTRSHAENKIDEMLEKISYPDEILKSHFLDKYYEEITMGDDWFLNIKNMKTFQVMKSVESYKKKVDRKSWIRPPITVEPDYSPVRNDIMFPISMFHLPFYIPNGPSAINFGAMGAIIGHEITHAFDITGRQYDSKGKLKEWWEPYTASQFEKTTTCMRSQYDKFKLGDLQINGLKTLDENIADNGGLRAAYIAFQLWERENGKTMSLPGVNLSDKQLFYVSFAQMFCSKWKKNGLRLHILQDNHCPGPIRVKGSLQNSNTFADQFNCPFIDNNYNPNIKCRVW